MYCKKFVIIPNVKTAQSLTVKVTAHTRAFLQNGDEDHYLYV